MPDVVVIGGGIAGCTTAYFLALDGVDVLLLEQAEVGSSASGVNAGSLHAQIQPEPFADYGDAWAENFLPAISLYRESMLMWVELGDTLGHDLHVELCGGLVIAETERDLENLERKVAFDRRGGLDIEMLDAAALADVAPYVAGEVVGAAFCPIEGKANPLAATRAVAAAARSAGADVREHQRVTQIRASRDGYSIETQSERFSADRVVNAAGNEAGRISALLDATLDLQSFPIQLAVTQPVSPLIDHLVYSAGSRLTLKQTPNGTIVIGGGWPAIVGDDERPRVDRQSLRMNLAVAIGVVPDLAEIGIVRTWAANVNGNESWLPVIGEAPGSAGFYINYVPWMGFSGAPMASRIVSNLVQGKAGGESFPIDAFAP